MAGDGEPGRWRPVFTAPTSSWQPMPQQPERYPPARYSSHRHKAALPGGWPSAVIRLWFTRTPERPGAEAGIFSGDFVLDNFFWLHRIYGDYIRWARATGGSALEAHLYGPADLLAQPDAALLAHAITDVTRAWPELKGSVLHAAVTRNDATHTLLHAGRPEEHLGVVTPWPGLFCCGDCATRTGDVMERAASPASRRQRRAGRAAAHLAPLAAPARRYSPGLSNGNARRPRAAQRVRGRGL